MVYSGKENREEAVLAGRGYACRRVLGQGAFSKVYWVEKREGGGSCACKVSSNVRLLEREAQSMAGLRHPLFPAYFDMWQEEGEGFLLMEYVPGDSMEEMLCRRGHFSMRQTVRVGMELAEGLSTLHQGPQRLLFRDVKPANSIIQQDGRVRLLDFGCVCTVGERADSRAGTPGFAAPEQLEGGGILTAACDVYGWGQTMKAMLGAKKPGGRAERRLLRLLAACTEPEPSARIPDMRSVMEALAPLCVESGRGRQEEAVSFFGRGIICHKNIVAIGKNA